MNIFEGLIKVRSEKTGVLNELHRVMGRFQVGLNLTPHEYIGDDGEKRLDIVYLYEPEPLPPFRGTFGEYCDEHDIDKRLQDELQNAGVDGALVILSRGILEILAKTRSIF